MGSFVQRSLRTVLLAATTALLAALSAQAGTLWVDGKATAEKADGSEASPFPAIQAAMDLAASGDEVVVHAGVYRETLRMRGGEEGKPLVLRAAEGERVIVTPARPVSGWTRSERGLWTALVDSRPEKFLVGRRAQPLAREPNESWWVAASAGAEALDAPQLRGLASPAVDGEVYAWIQKGNFQQTIPIAGFDPAAGRLTLGAITGGVKLEAGDRFWLQNRPEWIDRPGEWAAIPEGSRYRLFFLPARAEDLELVETATGSDSAIVVRKADHVRIEGLEVVAGQTGIEVSGCRDVEIRGCIAYHNVRSGISLREVHGGRVAACAAWYNSAGIGVSFSSGVTVEQCDVGANHVDGVLVTWKSDDVTVRRNYMHHHLRWGHPDNMQVYRDVTNLRILENLFLAGGQALMTEETRDGVLAGNTLVGSDAVMAIFGHANADNYRVERNTLILAGYGCMSLTGHDYQVRENIFMSGHSGPSYSVRGVAGYAGDRNLIWNSARCAKPTIMATEAGWLKDFAAVQRSLGANDQHSVYASPGFVRAPVALGVVDHRRLLDCTLQRWYLREGAARLFQVGDCVEADFDGVVRQVTGVDEASITVEPPLASLPPKSWLVANWAGERHFQLDLHLAPGSAAAHLAESGGPAGSTLDVAAYQRGDFDGDGRRDLPELPTDW